MLPSFESVNSDPPHSGTDTAVDQEAGLAHSPLPTNAPVCLGLADSSSHKEGGWKRLGVPEFTRPRSLGFHNCLWAVPIVSAFGGGMAGQGSVAEIEVPPHKSQPVDVGAQRLWGHR